MIFGDDITIFGDENLLFSFSIGKLRKKRKNCFGPIRSLFTFSTEKNIFFVPKYCTYYHFKITSQNITPDDRLIFIR